MRNFLLLLTILVFWAGGSAHAQKPIDWHPALDAYFGARLVEPEYAAMRDALALRLNRQTLDNVHPEEEYRAFQDYVKRARKQGGKRLKVRDADQLYQNMSEYLVLEANFETMRFRNAMEDALKLIEDHARSAPDWPSDFTETLMFVMNRRKMLVPSTVLFDVYLNPYRPIGLPSGKRIVQVSEAPEIVNDGHRIEVLLPLGPEPLVRMDFETVDLTGLIVEISNDGREYRGAMHIGAEVKSGITTPVIFPAPIRANHVRLIGFSPTRDAMLRELQLYTLGDAE